jgi:hypothetical protein
LNLEQLCISRIENGRAVYCQALNIDANFEKKYNKGKKTTTIDEKKNYIVASKWYRDKLRIEKNEDVTLIIRIEGGIKKWWAYQASKAHPENSMRLSVCLATLSLFLGLVGLVFGIASLLSDRAEQEIFNISKNQTEVMNTKNELKREYSKNNDRLISIVDNQKLISGSLSNIADKMDKVENSLDSSAGK